MTACFCSLAGTAACRTCSNNPFAETPPPVRTYTVSATNPVLFAGQKTNADRIRQMSDEELANTLHFMFVAYDFRDPLDILGWLKSPVEVDNGT